MTVIAPDHIGFRSWALAMTDRVDHDGLLPMPPMLDSDWRSWAYKLVTLPAMVGSDPPNPDAFDDWRAWARRLAATSEGQII